MHQIEALNRTHAGIVGLVYYYPYLDSEDLVFAEEEVAKGKSRFVKYLFAQVIHYLLVAAFLIYSPLKDDIMYQPTILFVILGFISLIDFISVTLREPGGSSKRGNFLKVLLLLCDILATMFTYTLMTRHILIIQDMKEVSSSLLRKLALLCIAACITDSSTKLEWITISLRMKMNNLAFQRLRATRGRIRIR